MRRSSAVVMVGLVLTLLSQSTAAGAATPNMQRVDDSFSFKAPFCPFPIRVATRITGTETLFFDNQGKQVRDVLNLFVYAVWRDPATGKSIIESDHVHNTVYPNDQGFDIVGLNFHLSYPGGGLVLVDAGRLVSDSDGNLLFEAGRHPIQDGNVSALCSALA
jgi:hypothetical protein